MNDMTTLKPAIGLDFAVAVAGGRSGSSASLMLTLEAVFTAVLAWRWYGESMDKRVALAVLLLLAGGLVLVMAQGVGGQVRLWGLLAVMLASGHIGPASAWLRARASFHGVERRVAQE